MLPWKTIIQWRKDCDTPIYLQIANSIIVEMKKGRIGPGIKMPGTRLMSEILEVHRKTVVRAYEELDAQGWIEMHPSQGSFTSKELPEINPRKWNKSESPHSFPATTGYPVTINHSVREPVLPYRNIIGFHDGPDVRLIPVEEIGRAYKSALSRHANLRYLSYVEITGVQKFREVLSEYLNSSRGLQTSPDNIMITRVARWLYTFLLKFYFQKVRTSSLVIPIITMPIMCSLKQV
jgi:GntR family transcriptional regulator/MocR family aminotransferase